MRTLLFALGLGLFLIGMRTNAGLQAFIDPPSVLIVVVPTLLFAAATHSPRGVWAAVTHGLGAGPVAEADAQPALAALRSLRSISLASGVLGTLIGLVSMLTNLADPTAIGPAVAVALLCPLYAVFLSEICVRPLSHRIEARVST